MSGQSSDASLQRKFELLDANGDGNISLTEFAEFCADMDMDPITVAERFHSIDTNGDGLLSFEEFKTALRAGS